MSESNPSLANQPVPRRRGWLLWGVAALVAIAALWVLSLEVALWQGASCLQDRQNERALSWLTYADRFGFERAELDFLLARCYRRMDDFDRTAEHLKRAHQLGWDVRQLEREQWLALAQTSRFDEVNPHWAALFDAPGSDGPEICKAYVTGALALFRISDALRVLSAWQADYPADPEPYILRGQLATTMLSWAEAVKLYGRALELDPGRDDARLGLARALIRVGEVQQAEEHLGRLRQSSEHGTEAHLLYAQALVKLGKAELAEETLTEFVRQQPAQVDGLLELGNLLLASGRSAEALEILKRAVERRPENREIVYAYGKALQAQGQSQEASACFKFVDEATKPLIELKSLMSRLLADPENLGIRFQVAYITWKYRSREEGEKWFRSLLKLAPDHEPTHAALAIHYRLQGDEQQAALHRELAGTIDVDQFFSRSSKGEPTARDSAADAAADRNPGSGDKAANEGTVSSDTP